MKHETIYRTVKVSERLPEIGGYFLTPDGYLYYNDIRKKFYYDDESSVFYPNTEWWLEPLSNVYVHTEDELKEMFDKFDALNWFKLWAEGKPMTYEIKEILKDNYKIIAALLKTSDDIKLK